MTTTPSSISYTLFGLTNPFLPPSWTTTDDRVRGGSSTSHLTALPHNSALFSGHLDTSTLGGAGFASQFSPIDAANSDSQTQEKNGSWDLSAYSGIELEIGKVDEKMYTFILKDEEQAEKREDGREKSGVSWEVEFRAGDSAKEAGNEETTKIWILWSDFKATYRGKKKKDAGSLRTGQIRRVGLMMRSYFDKQCGDFSLEIKAITARRQTSQAPQSTLQVPFSNEPSEKKSQQSTNPQTGGGSLAWLSNTCTVS